MLEINEEVEIPENVDVSIKGRLIKAKGEKGELELAFFSPKIEIGKGEKAIHLKSKKATKREKRMVGTFKAHIRNMIKGVSKGYAYKLKICSSHFPMKVSIKEGVVEINNFLGEKIPRKAGLLERVSGKIEGDEIILEGISKEEVGQSAANIERACKVTRRDKRRFEDGIYIIAKGDKKII